MLLLDSIGSKNVTNQIRSVAPLSVELRHHPHQTTLEARVWCWGYLSPRARYVADSDSQHYTSDGQTHEEILQDFFRIDGFGIALHAGVRSQQDRAFVLREFGGAPPLLPNAAETLHGIHRARSVHASGELSTCPPTCGVVPPPFLCSRALR